MKTTYRCDYPPHLLHIEDQAEKAVICSVDRLASMLTDHPSSSGAYRYQPVGVVNNISHHQPTDYLKLGWHGRKVRESHVYGPLMIALTEVLQLSTILIGFVVEQQVPWIANDSFVPWSNLILEHSHCDFHGLGLLKKGLLTIGQRKMP